MAREEQKAADHEAWVKAWDKALASDRAAWEEKKAADHETWVKARQKMKRST